MRFACVALVGLAGLSACGELAGTVKLNQAAARSELPAKAEKSCRAVTAIATGFGEQNVTGFAQSNLDEVIDRTKDQMAAEGSKGFTIEARAVKCEGYIDFGGAVGREHKCHASAQLCGKG